MIPLQQEGGEVEREGIAYLHDREIVVPADAAAAARAGMAAGHPFYRRPSQPAPRCRPPRRGPARPEGRRFPAEPLVERVTPDVAPAAPAVQPPAAGEPGFVGGTLGGAAKTAGEQAGAAFAEREAGSKGYVQQKLEDLFDVDPARAEAAQRVVSAGLSAASNTTASTRSSRMARWCNNRRATWSKPS